ncbi:MAG: type II secretion system F family protein, partial [Nitrospiraceae bacterium]|nr:type II secretion system F family protein [Nitrospiraceae bacterium]
MATVFQWSGKTKTGAVEGGEMAAGSRDEVIAQLRKRNIIATSVTKKKKEIVINLPFGSPIKDKDVVIFTRQFSTMI